MENSWFELEYSTRENHVSKRAENNFDPDEGNKTLCGACTLPIFSTPSRLFMSVHFHPKCCPDQQQQQHLPGALSQHPLHPSGILNLHKKLPPRGIHRVRCDNCLDDCKAFFYQCPDEGCRYTLDLKCSTTIKVVHRSHKHELTFIPKNQKSLSCQACGLQHPTGFFYACDFCHFYLHQDCALLPNVILLKSHENKQHPLALTFSIPEASFKYQFSDNCSICMTKLLSIKSGAYFCTICDYASHVKCAVFDKTNVSQALSIDVAEALPHFPPKDQNSLSLYLQEQKSKSGTVRLENKLKNPEIHDHELVLNEDVASHQLSPHLLCDACIEPIFPPFYNCIACSDFYLHSCCAYQPARFRHPSHCSFKAVDNREPIMKLVTKRSSAGGGTDDSHFLSGSFCAGCFKYSNGFYYECPECAHRLDVRCAHFPNAITYELHGKSHILFLSYGSTTSSICPCCTNPIGSFFYECTSCPNFKIDAHCALLPIRVSHKYDKHSLQLTSPQGSTLREGNGGDDDFCEICEEGMANNQWFYHCEECVTSFHIRCIPCVGESSMIKTGRTISVDCHNCPLTSIHMLENYSYTCSHCHETIQGKEDAVAFECSRCSFWLHSWCVQYHHVAGQLTTTHAA